jgi:ankyrin repeat protein
MSRLLDALSAADPAAALSVLADDPAAAHDRTDGGVSALLLARYRGMTEVVDAIRSARPLDLAEAAAVDDVRTVGALLAGGASADGRSPDGFTVLQLACHFDAVGAAALLVRAGADVTARATGAMDVQALHAAAASPTGACIPLLLAAGAPVDETQRGGFTPLHEAATRSDGRMAELLLAAGADPTLRTDDDRDAAAIAEATGATDLATRLRAG